MYWQECIEGLPRKTKLVLLGDFNAKVGSTQHSNMPDVVGNFGLGSTNEEGHMLLQVCAFNKLAITNTTYKHNENRRVTWISPDGNIHNQIDYIIINQHWKKTIKNSRSYHSADIGSDHSLVVAKFKIKLVKPKKSQNILRQYDVAKLKSDKALGDAFKIKIGGAFQPLLQLANAEVN